MTKEQKFYQKFKSLLTAKCDMCRVENSMMSGMPDVSCCLNGVEAWVELKVYEGGRVLIRPAQFAWARRRAEADGRVFIAALHPIGNIHVWRYPRVSVTPYGKYLLVSTEHYQDVVDAVELTSILFIH